MLPLHHRSIPGAKLHIFLKRRQAVAENVVKGQPESEAGALSDEHEEGAATEVQLVEAQAYRKDVAHEGQPGQES